MWLFAKIPSKSPLKKTTIFGKPSEIPSVIISEIRPDIPLGISLDNTIGNSQSFF